MIDQDDVLIIAADMRVMLDLLKNLRLGAKISLLGAGSALILALALLGLAAWQSNQYNMLAQKAVDDLIYADLDHITQGIYTLVKTVNDAVQQQVNDNLRVARHLLSAAGEVSLDAETVLWPAVNQFTGERRDVRLPKMLVGGHWLDQNTDSAVETIVVDAVTRLVGDTATIFQRMNDRGDMLRVATTIKTADGKRAIGTYIPAINPDGQTNPVIASVLRGETYRGRAFVVNAWHITAYEPLMDSSGRLAGMLYVGFAQKDAEARVRQAIIQTKVGKSGYVFVLGGKAEERGRYIVSQRGERDGEDIWASRDSDGQPMVQSIIRTAIALKPGELGTERYRWQNPGETSLRWKVARLAYFEPWDWVIGTSVYDDELRTHEAFLSEGRKRMTATMGMVGLGIALLIGLASILIARTIARPVQHMTQVAEIIAHGDLTRNVSVHSNGEIGILANAFNFMTVQLRETLEGLRKSEEQFRSLFENALEGIFQTSVEGRILKASPGFARILGYDSTAEIEQTLNDIAHQLYVHPKDRQAILSMILERGTIVGQEVQFYRKDKQKIWVSLSVRVVRDHAGRILHLQGFVTDVSERKRVEIERTRLEDQFLQAQKMESVGRLAGGVAHDFNNMLQVILGNTALALEVVPPDNSSREFLEEIQKAARRSSDLTRQLLAFARKQTISPKILDLRETISGMLKMLQRLIGEDIQLLWIPGADLWPVKIDPGQVDQILANLAVNARDAIEGVGKVTIETANVTFDDTYARSYPEYAPGDYVMLAVTDTGHGMDNETRAHLFEPFFTTKEVGKGTGLGLATVFGIIKQNNGLINVYSEPSQGTTFKIYFPRAQAEAEAAAKPLALRSLRGTETVLLVEDEEQVLNLGRRILEQYGYTVLAASTPQAAIIQSSCYSGTIHLLITDVVMPGMNGKELTQLLMASRTSIKCLFMSGYTANVIAHHGVLDEGVQFLQKPFTIRSLTERVREVLDGAEQGN